MLTTEGRETETFVLLVGLIGAEPRLRRGRGGGWCLLARGGPGSQLTPGPGSLQSIDQAGSSLRFLDRDSRYTSLLGFP